MLASTTMVYLQELPFDVLLHILSFLKPRDTILGFRQVCRPFLNAEI
jgi:hypothetical protein